jgi:hypothetical protein
MGRITDNGLIEIAYLNVDVAFNVGYRSDISGMPIPTYPYIGSNRNRCLNRLAAKPFVELRRITTT